MHTFFRYFPVSERDRRFGLYLTTAGESRIPPGFAYPPAGHPGAYQFDWRKGRVLREYQIVYISSGQGRLEAGQARWRIGSGSCFLLYPGTWHRYRPDPRTGWHEHWVGCDGPVVRGLVRNGFFSPQRPVVRVRDEDLLLGAFSSVIDAIHDGRPALQQVAAGATLYIMSLLYSALQPGQEGRQDVARAIHEAMRRMADPTQETPPLPELARHLGVSYSVVPPRVRPPHRPQPPPVPVAAQGGPRASAPQRDLPHGQGGGLPLRLRERALLLPALQAQDRRRSRRVAAALFRGRIVTARVGSHRRSRRMSDSEERIDRRTFLGTSGMLAAGAAVGTTALSYARILGANDRIALGHIGVGNRGGELLRIVAALKSSHNVEMTAVCDLWTVNREKAVSRQRPALRARAARLPASRGPAGAQGSRWGADLHSRALALSDPEDGRWKPARTPTWKSRWGTCWTT